jgi:hypothetical protein
MVLRTCNGIGSRGADPGTCTPIFVDKSPAQAQTCVGTIWSRWRSNMAKSQKKSSREARKPKAEKPKKPNASNPTQKGIAVSEKAGK